MEHKGYLLVAINGVTFVADDNKDMLFLFFV